jgi:hypothetical protein
MPDPLAKLLSSCPWVYRHRIRIALGDLGRLCKLRRRKSPDARCRTRLPGSPPGTTAQPARRRLTERRHGGKPRPLNGPKSSRPASWSTR